MLQIVLKNEKKILILDHPVSKKIRFNEKPALNMKFCITLYNYLLYNSDLFIFCVMLLDDSTFFCLPYS